MRQLIRFVAIAALAVHLGACAQLQKAYEKVEAVATSDAVGNIAPRVAIASIATYDGFVVLATEYQNQPRCNGTNGPICRDPALRQQIDAAVYSGRQARNGLKRFMRANPDKAVPLTAYNALVAANDTIDKATAAYRAALGR